MKYTLIGLKINPITLDVVSTLELTFSSYTEARSKQLILSQELSDMSFHIDFNQDYVSLDSLLTQTSKSVKVNPKHFN